MTLHLWKRVHKVEYPAPVSIQETHFKTKSRQQETTMVIEYHLQRPSIGIFLWTVIYNGLGGGAKKSNKAFAELRTTFHKEYVLPIGQSLGYDGVVHSKHFEQDWFTPYHLDKDHTTMMFPPIKGHERSPVEENRRNWDMLNDLMNKIESSSTEVVPNLYLSCMKK